MDEDRLYVGRADGDLIGDFTFVSLGSADAAFEWEDEPVECVVYRLVPTGERRTFGPAPIAEEEDE